MDYPPPLAGVPYFIAALSHRTDAYTAGVLSHSIHAWLSYYRCLRMVLTLSRSAVTSHLWPCFYPFAQAVLDHLAETYCLFFAVPWIPAEMSHWRLTHAFPAFCAEHRFQGDGAALHALMRELCARIVEPNTHGDTPYVSTCTEHVVMPPHAQLTPLLACLEQYIVALLKFFAANLEHSVLQCPSHAEPPADSSTPQRFPSHHEVE